MTNLIANFSTPNKLSLGTIYKYISGTIQIFLQRADREQTVTNVPTYKSTKLCTYIDNKVITFFDFTIFLY